MSKAIENLEAAQQRGSLSAPKRVLAASWRAGVVPYDVDFVS